MSRNDEFRLRHMLGLMESHAETARTVTLATQIIDQQVSGIIEKHADAFEDELWPGADTQRRRSIAFLFLVAKTAFDLADDEAVDGIVDGGDDFGIDALYFDSPEDTELSITLIQGKYRSSLRGDSAFPENEVAKMINAVDALFDPQKPVNLNTRLNQRIEDIRSFVKDGAIPRVTAVAANNGIQWTKNAQQRIDNARKDFGGQVEWRYIGPDDLLALLQAQRPISAELQLIGQATVETFDFRRVLVGRMSVAELARLTNEHGNQLFERNIRRYLGLAGNSVNEAIASTLREPDQRPNFYFYNNGITFTCSQFRHNALQKGNWRLRINDLQVINGGQTARTVQQIAKEIGSDIIQDAEVLIRVYELAQHDNELIDAITFATNSQNPVDLRDLKANEPRQKALDTSIRGLGYAYRAKREDQSVSLDEFTSAVVAEAVLAIWRYRPHQARFRRRDHFGGLYHRIFSEDLNGAQAIIAALLLRYAEKRRKRPRQDAPDFLAYGSRFIAMLMGHYLLTEMGIGLGGLDHRNFQQARELVERESDSYFARAQVAVGKALTSLFDGRERTLQRLSATFRRADLVDMLLHPSAA